MTRRGGAIVGAAMIALVVFALAVFMLPFAFPTPPPIITRFSGTQLFSPNGDGARDAAMFSIRVRDPGTLDLTVADDKGTVVKTLADAQVTTRGWLRIPWRGRGDDGQLLPDGQYSVRVHARADGKVFSASRRVRIVTVPPRIERYTVASLRTPPGDTSCRMSATLADDGTVEVHVRPEPATPSAAVVRRFGPRPAKAGDPVSWRWAGDIAGGTPVPGGLYSLTLAARDSARNTSTASRTCWIGHLTGRLVGPVRRGGLVNARLTTSGGATLSPSTPVTLQLYRRVGTPGDDPAVLGSRVAHPVRTRAGQARIRIPASVAPTDLWLVARTRDGAALITVGAR